MTDRAWLPNFVIAGAPKAATSSMYSWIADHPDAFGSKNKETYFFVDAGTHMYRPGNNISDGIDSYKLNFPIPENLSPKVILEATPSYIYSASALEHIPKLSSQPRCLFILREPAEQVYSVFRYFQANWNWIPEGMTFAEFLSAVRSGSHAFNGNEIAQNAIDYARYVVFLERWRDRLGEGRMMVVTFDDLKADHTKLTRRVASWLGLDPAFYETYTYRRQNETYSPRIRTLHRLNLIGRGHLPKGRAYNALRSLYRRLNTSKPDGPNPNDMTLIRELRTDYVHDNARLADLFSLDLSAWGAHSPAR